MSTDHANRSAVDAVLVVRAGTCATLLGSAVVHATVVAEHYEVWPPAGLFFLVLLVVEALLAIGVVMAWGRGTALLVVLTSLGTLAVWAVSRTVGVPIGPEALQGREAVGVPDLACVVLEVVAAALVTPWAFSRRPRGSASGTRPNDASVLAAGAVVLLAAAVTGWGLGPALSGTESHVHEHGQESALLRP